VIKLNLIATLARPLDFGLTVGGRRVFGDNKTWRGAVLMSAVSAAIVYVQARLYALEPFRHVSIIDYSRTSWIALGVALGISYSISELPNSFFKRRLGIPPGGVSQRRSSLQYVVDQADSAIGGTLALALFIGGAAGTLLLVFVVGFALHALVDRLFFLFGVKRRTRLVSALPLEESPTC
jgi:CDP-diglyceride synthetase